MQFSDAQLAEQLVGTWITQPSDGDVVSTVTYHADGTAVEVVAFGNQPERDPVEVGMKWEVKENVLTFKSVSSSNPNIVPVGFELKDRILSISDDRFTFEAFQGYGIGDGEQGVKVRKG